MSGIAERTSKEAGAAAAASEQASANVDSVVSAAEQLSASIGEISHQVAQSADIAVKAVEEAGRTTVMVAGLANAALKIGEVVSLIQDIASQTNLVALNATIEAARAGDAGKGFAVVASEVKGLANQTAQATEGITTQINEIRSATEGVVGAIKGIGATIREISDIAASVAAAVEEQGAATREIARNTQEAAKRTGDASANIAGVSRGTGETGAAAAHVLSSADHLSQQAAMLEREIDRFLATIRAA
jgi:methyl-accepting chemotaxis protein